MKRALVAIVLVTAVAVADDDETSVPAPPPARGISLVKPTATWRWQTYSAPRIARGVGAMAVTGVDAAQGRRPAPANVLGDPAPIPPQWPYDVVGTAAEIGRPTDGNRIAAAFGVTTFQVTDPTIAMLELRLHYEDGVAVWINGIEVARQALKPGPTTTLASQQHGPEWETFYIPAAPGLLHKGSNTLAIEVHPSGRRIAPRLVADLIGRSDRGIVRGPSLVDATDTTATILVETDPDVEAILEWGAGGATDRVIKSPAGRRHKFVLDKLAANARFSYRVRAGSTASRPYGFHTMPAAGSVIRIGVYGDVRGGHAMHRRLVDHMLDEGLDMIAVTGDMVLHGSDEADWQRFFSITQDLRAQVPYYPAVGNHDLGWDGADGSNRAERMFALPPGPAGRPADAYWYSRDLADVHLVFLDSNSYDRPEQETWLDADLAAARKRKVRAILAFTHDGPYSRGYHGGSTMARARFVPLLAKYKVDLIFSGHDHLYQRGEINGLRYVVTGGGGASLYAIRCGVPGKPKCNVDDGMVTVAREHHYGVVSIGRDLELCTRRPDGSLLEKCVHFALGRP